MKKLEKRVSAVLVAAGSSTRMGFDKLSFDLGGETVLHRSIRAFEQDPLVTEIVLVAGKNRAFVEQQAADCTKPVQIVTGGTTRAESAKTACWRQQGSLWQCTTRQDPSSVRPSSQQRWKQRPGAAQLHPPYR